MLTKAMPKIKLRNDFANYNFVPNFKKIFQPSDDVFYTIEQNEKGWFRILRIKNKHRSHDFIINNFINNEIFITNDDSKEVRAILDSKEDLTNLFLYVAEKNLFYRNYERNGQKYSPKGRVMTLGEIESLFEIL